MMKTKLLWACIPVSLLFLSQIRLTAQPSCITFTSNYATYADISADSTNLYSSVLVDGTGSMTVNTFIPGCNMLNISNASHTPVAVNSLSSSDGTSSIGGGVYGSPVCPTCYLSAVNNKALPWTQGVNYNFQWTGEVICNMGGPVYEAQGLFIVIPTLAIYEFDHLAPGTTAYYRLSCPNNTHATCPHYDGVTIPLLGAYYVGEIQVLDITFGMCRPGNGSILGPIIPIDPKGPLYRCW